LIHVVSGGETREDISTILLWYTGAEENIAPVQTANPGLDLTDLKPGQRILIPSNLVTQTTAMPRRKFTLGVDAAPTPRPIGAAETTTSDKKADPLEELMRRNQRGGNPTPIPTYSLSDSAPTSSLMGSTGVSSTSPQRDVATPEKEKSVGAPKLESFSDEEIGASPEASVSPKEGLDVSPNKGSGAPMTEQPSLEIKNPRLKRQLQPEVFDEE
jgi:hypothetical protein